MLDEKNDQLSSDSAEGEMNKENEATPLKSKEGEHEKDDKKIEEAGADVKVSKEEEIESVEDAKPLAQEKSGDAEEEAKEEVKGELKEEVVAEVKEEVKEEVVADAAEVKEESKEEAVEVEKKAPVVEIEKEVVEASKEVPAATENKNFSEIPVFDLAIMSLDDIVKMIRQLLSDFEIKDVKNQIESLKIDFQKKFSSFIMEQKEAFIKAGGEEAEFFLSAPVKHKFDELVGEYKKKRQHFYKEIERTQKENLELRLSLIDDLKALIDNAESSTMYKNFRALQDRWREVGQIPHGKYNDVWRTYHHHVERFYDLLHLNNDFRDLDFRHNLEEKTKLITA